MVCWELSEPQLSQHQLPFPSIPFSFFTSIVSNLSVLQCFGEFFDFLSRVVFSSGFSPGEGSLTNVFEAFVHRGNGFLFTILFHFFSL